MAGRRKLTPSQKYDMEMAEYRKNRTVWLAQQKQERGILDKLPVMERKLDELAVRFEHHLQDEKAEREKDRAERMLRQAEHNKDIKEIKDSITQILDIKRSTELMLKIAKWLAVVGAAIASILKFVLPLFKHKS